MTQPKTPGLTAEIIDPKTGETLSVENIVLLKAELTVEIIDAETGETLPTFAPADASKAQLARWLLLSSRGISRLRDLQRDVKARLAEVMTAPRTLAGGFTTKRKESKDFDGRSIRALWAEFYNGTPSERAIAEKYLRVEAVKPNLTSAKALLEAEVDEDDMSELARFTRALKAARKPDRVDFSAEVSS